MDALERDFYEERRRKWRRSAFWRGFLVAAVLAAILAAWIASDTVSEVREHIARIEVAGLITDDPERDEMLAELAETGTARAVVVRINSPGGTTAGSEALFASLRRIAEKKPVVAVLGDLPLMGGQLNQFNQFDQARPWLVLDAMHQFFDVRFLGSVADRIPQDADILMLAQPEVCPDCGVELEPWVSGCSRCGRKLFERPELE